MVLTYSLEDQRSCSWVSLLHVNVLFSCFSFKSRGVLSWLQGGQTNHSSICKKGIRSWKSGYNLCEKEKFDWTSHSSYPLFKIMQDHCKMQFKSTHYVVEVPCSYLTLTSGVLWRVFLPLSIVLHSNCAGEEGQDEACLTQTVQAGTWTPHFSNCTSWLVGKWCHWSKRGNLQALKSAQLSLHGTHTSYYSIFCTHTESSLFLHWVNQSVK